MHRATNETQNQNEAKLNNAQELSKNPSVQSSLV